MSLKITTTITIKKNNNKNTNKKVSFKMRFTYILAIFVCLFSVSFAKPECFKKYAMVSCMSHFKNLWPVCYKKGFETVLLYKHCVSDECDLAFKDCHSRVDVKERKGYAECESEIKKALTELYKKDWSYIQENYICEDDE